jgi:hypothetical protein
MCTMMRTDKNLAAWTFAGMDLLEDDGSRLDLFYRQHRTLLLDLQMLVRRLRVQLFALLITK